MNQPRPARDTAAERRTFCIGATAAIGTLWVGSTAAAADTVPIVSTQYGKVRGFNEGRVSVFRNVPYGNSTAGARRWKAPVPPVKWRGIRDALEPGFMSPQGNGGPIPEEAVMLQSGPKGEDCLNVNIYTPSLRLGGHARPVMVWFHGGGFGAGSGNSDSTDGGNMARHHDVVFVTVTHRLNVFGFLYLADLFGSSFADSGNVGMLDCIAALKWVRDNIAHFGGDTGNVTVVGQSGGGMKVSVLMAMPAAQGLFHRAIIQSGGLVRATPREQAAANARRLVEALGVKSAEELQALPWEDVIGAMEANRIQAGPVVDERALPNHPFDPVAPATSRSIPLLIGSTETESTFFPFTTLEPIDEVTLAKLVKSNTRADDAEVERLIELFKKTYPGKENVYLFQLLSSQNGLQTGVDTVAERKAEQGGAPAYAYYFTKHTPVRDGRLRSPHTLDIPYAFDNLGKATSIAGPVTADNQALADRISASWASFARTGNPNHPGIPVWPTFELTERATMILDDFMHVVNDPLKATRAALAAIRARVPAGPPPGGPP